MPDSPAHRILSRAQRPRDPLDEIRALNGSGEVAPRVVTVADRRAAPLNEESPADAFDRYLAEHEPDLPDRYRYPGRRTAHPYYGGPAIGLAVVVVVSPTQRQAWAAADLRPNPSCVAGSSRPDA